PEEKLGLARLRKFWRAAEATVPRIENAFEQLTCVTQDVGSQYYAGRRPICGSLFKARMNFRGGISEIIAPRFPELMNVVQQLQESRSSVTIVGREIRSAKKWFQVRR